MTEQKQRRKPCRYTDEFKQQLVDLYRSGKRKCDICRGYDIAYPLFDKWIKHADDPGPFHEKDNRMPEQEELMRLRKELEKKGGQVSRRRIGRIMRQEGLVSDYTTAQSKPQKDKCNEVKVENILDRQFNGQGYRNVVVSDLTYVRVGKHWDYICVLVDLSNREIIGYSAGEHKTAELVREAFMSVDGNLSDIHISHTDRGNEFKDKTIGDILEIFGIERSLSYKGCPYDNAVAEATL